MLGGYFLERLLAQQAQDYVEDNRQQQAKQQR
jgi:hypothetical protein